MFPLSSSRWSWLLLALAFLFLNSSSRADDWPQWLGPQRDGIWRETGIIDKFPAGKPNILWRKPIGPGYTGPAVVNGRIYLMDRQKPEAKPNAKPKPGAGTERVLCLNAADGSLIWKHEYDCTYSKIGFPSGPRTTPLIHDGKVFTLGTMGDLYCLDARTGKPHWHRNFIKDLKAPVPFWGWSAHPLLVGDKLICTVGKDGCGAIAFDKNTGRELWRALSTEEIACAPPTLIEAGNTRQVIIWLCESVNSLNPDTGKVYWSIPYPENGKPQQPSVNITAPLLIGKDKLFVGSFYHGSLMIQLAADKPEAKVLWRSKSNNPSKTDTVHAVMSTPIARDGHIYCMDSMGELRCLKVATGERVWETLAALNGKRALFGTVFFVQNGDRYFGFNDQGNFLMARLTPRGYEELGRLALLKPTQFARGRNVVLSHPAFANRCVFARNDEEIICLSLAAVHSPAK